MNVARQWREVEIALTGPLVERPYLTSSSRSTSAETPANLNRLVFWDGDALRVRFASTTC